MESVKSIGISVDAVLDQFDCKAFAVTLRVVFSTGRLLVCIGFGDTFEEAEEKAYTKFNLSSHKVV
uniref:Non-structural protein 3a n=1 Tax=Feline coronavirus TaxID=12663 RepID=A0A7G7FCK8_9ALPC|nr:accessory protein 3a [Feline coronavirus]